ncbi:TPA: hypothetical protein HA244_07215, partial [Candidatus Micrarchaeota archaeon]|nr:hypothetical protein [Candidatus Micrarchaeota archaeon]
EKKKVSSRAGMRQTVGTSVLFKARLTYLPKLIADMKKAVLAKDFPAFAELTMRESSNMHAVMLDTWPPITYLNDSSKEIMHAVHELNGKGVIAGYTFDAGPNAHVYTTEKNVGKVKQLLFGIQGVRKIIVCNVGEGPKYLKEGHLIGSKGEVKKAFFDESAQKIVVD